MTITILLGFSDTVY